MRPPETVVDVVGDVRAAVAFFRDAVGLDVRQEFDEFAELDSGGMSIMLSPSALVPVDRARGVILHFRVEDVAAVAARAGRAGAEILMGPGETPFGTESVMIRGPEQIIVELYRDLPANS